MTKTQRRRLAEQSKDVERVAIQAWVDDRMGTPNQFNTQLLSDFLKFAREKLGYHKGSKTDEYQRGYEKAQEDYGQDWPDEVRDEHGNRYRNIGTYIDADT